jgi:hypothetical protein
MSPVIIAALIQASISLGVAAFQVALVAGAPWGEYAMGGQNPGTLPSRLRIASGVSALIMLAQSGHYLAQAGVLTPLLPHDLNAVVNWFWFAFTAIGLVMNSITRSKKERNLWVPVLAVSFVATLVVALNA